MLVRSLSVVLPHWPHLGITLRALKSLLTKSSKWEHSKVGTGGGFKAWVGQLAGSILFLARSQRYIT